MQQLQPGGIVKTYAAFTPADVARGNCKMLLPLNEAGGASYFDLVSGAKFTPTSLVWVAQGAQIYDASGNGIPASGSVFKGLSILPAQGFIAIFGCNYTIPASPTTGRKVYMGGKIAIELTGISLNDDAGILFNNQTYDGTAPAVATDTSGMIVMAVSAVNGSNIRTMNAYYSNGGSADAATMYLAPKTTPATTSPITFTNALYLGTGTGAADARSFLGASLIVFPGALPGDVINGTRWMYESWKIKNRVIPPWWV